MPNKPRTDQELLMQMLCTSDHDFKLNRAMIELEPFKYFWRAVLAQADAHNREDLVEWVDTQLARFGLEH